MQEFAPFFFYMGNNLKQNLKWKRKQKKVWNGIKEGVHFVGTVAGTIIAVAGAAKVLRKGK